MLWTFSHSFRKLLVIILGKEERKVGKGGERGGHLIDWLAKYVIRCQVLLSLPVSDASEAVCLLCRQVQEHITYKQASSSTEMTWRNHSHKGRHLLRGSIQTYILPRNRVRSAWRRFRWTMQRWWVLVLRSSQPLRSLNSLSPRCRKVAKTSSTNLLLLITPSLGSRFMARWSRISGSAKQRQKSKPRQWL